MVRQDGGRPGLRSAGGRKKHEGVGTQKALCMNKGSRKPGARREHYTFRQSREGASRRKSYKAERNGKGGGAKPSKHKEERRRQM